MEMVKENEVMGWWNEMRWNESDRGSSWPGVGFSGTSAEWKSTAATMHVMSTRSHLRRDSLYAMPSPTPTDIDGRVSLTVTAPSHGADIDINLLDSNRSNNWPKVCAGLIGSPRGCLVNSITACLCRLVTWFESFLGSNLLWLAAKLKSQSRSEISSIAMLSMSLSFSSLGCIALSSTLCCCCSCCCCCCCSRCCCCCCWLGEALKNWRFDFGDCALALRHPIAEDDEELDDDEDDAGTRFSTPFFVLRWHKRNEKPLLLLPISWTDSRNVSTRTLWHRIMSPAHTRFGNTLEMERKKLWNRLS